MEDLKELYDGLIHTKCSSVLLLVDPVDEMKSGQYISRRCTKHLREHCIHKIEFVKVSPNIYYSHASVYDITDWLSLNYSHLRYILLNTQDIS